MCSSDLMNAIYSGDADKGAEAAEIACRLGRYSPYKFYYEASAAIAATLQGRHEDAIRIGTRVLAKRPFQPVMRHLFASHALQGNVDEALAVYRHLRALDPGFGTEEMKRALPSARSLELIGEGLRRVGLEDRVAGG